MASRFPPFTRDTPRYHKTKHIAILIWNHTTKELLRSAEEAVKAGVRVDIREYMAA
jgi:hypothetical protein